MLFTRSAISQRGDKRMSALITAWPSVLTIGLSIAMGTSVVAKSVGQAPKPPAAKPTAPVSTNATATVPVGVPVTPDYVIGPEDVLTVVVWKETDVSGDVVVRPDGMISLPLLNDITAAGLTPEQLRVRITEAAKKYIEEPTVTVVVKAINRLQAMRASQEEKDEAEATELELLTQIRDAVVLQATGAAPTTTES